MAGSLRALWPWQDDDRGLLAPSGSVGLTCALFALGAAVVIAVLVVEHRAQGRKAEPSADEPKRGRHARVTSGSRRG